MEIAFPRRYDGSWVFLPSRARGNKMKHRNTLFAVLIATAAILLAPVYGPEIRARAAAPADDLDRDMRAVASAFALVEKNFADPVSSEKAFFEGAIPGMLHTLDPHSNFVNPTEYREMQ